MSEIERESSSPGEGSGRTDPGPVLGGGRLWGQASAVMGTGSGRFGLLMLKYVPHRIGCEATGSGCVGVISLIGIADSPDGRFVICEKSMTVARTHSTL